MNIVVNKQSFFLFDLDDTLYAEIDYVKSAFAELATYMDKKSNTLSQELLNFYFLYKNVYASIEKIGRQYDLDINKLCDMYRMHFPVIHLKPGVSQLIDTLKKYNIPMGVITNGRSVTQRNKLKALKIENVFTEVLISEEIGYKKPDKRIYDPLIEKYENFQGIYFGDNPTIDFICPNQLGWQTYMLINDGTNIHSQDRVVDKNHRAHNHFFSFSELRIIMTPRA